MHRILEPAPSWQSRTLDPTPQEKSLLGGLLLLIDWFIPTTRPVDAELQRRGRLLVASSLGFGLIGLFFTVQLFGITDFPLSGLLGLLLASTLVISNLFVLKLTRSIPFPGTLLCLETMVIIAYLALVDGGITDPSLMWNLVIPWLAAFLVSPRAGFIFAALVVAELTGFYLLETSGYPFPRVTPAAEMWWFYFLQGSALAIFTAILGWLYEGQTLKNLRESNRKLTSAHEALQASNRRVEGILESITNGFFALDRQGRFTYVNRRAELLLQKTREQVLGRSVYEQFPEEFGSVFLTEFKRAAKEQAAREFEAFYAPLNIWFEVHVYPFQEGLTVYFSDATDRKHAEAALVSAKEQAEEAARLKSVFLANMSHEIRTPLTGIIGFAAVMAEEVAVEHREFAQLIEQSGRRLLDTLNSVLDLARLESGMVESEPEVVDVIGEAMETVRMLSSLAVQKGLDLRVEVHTPDVSALVDSTFLNRILNNVVGNAIKFTEAGEVVVGVEADAHYVHLQIRDTGIGISPEFLPSLFDEFRQESSGLTRSHEGSGLGLAIVKRLVWLMKGRLSVESEKGVGTVFTVSLPRVPYEQLVAVG